MSRYTIKHGHHRAKPLRLGLYLNKKTIAFKVLFDTSCKYHIDGEDMEDINKLFGIGYLPNHHKESARFGWRYNEAMNMIQIFSYCYVQGKRVTEYITSVQLNRWITLAIKMEKGRYIFTAKKDELETSFQTNHYHNKKIGYRLNLYFGGNQPAVHDITIEMKKL